MKPHHTASPIDASPGRASPGRAVHTARSGADAPPVPSARLCACRGFTLIEVVMATAITSIIFLAIGSSMVLTARALPNAEDHRTIREARAMDEMVSDLELAIAFTERSSQAVTFTVPDRTGDGSPETIRYAWSGVPGDPLIRQVNGGTVSSFIAGVRALDLDYAVEHEQIVTPTFVESNEVELRSHTGLLSLFGLSVTESNWVAQYFVPALPGHAVSWSVTRVVIRAQRGSSGSGASLVQIRSQRPDRSPGTLPIQQHVMNSSSLPGNYDWQEFTFDNVRGISPDAGLCLTIIYDHAPGNHSSAVIQYRSSLLPHFSNNLLTTTNSGSSWSYRTNDSLRYYVYGRYVMPGTPDVENVYRLRHVTVEMTTVSQMQATAQILSRPDVGGP